MSGEDSLARRAAQNDFQLRYQLILDEAYTGPTEEQLIAETLETEPRSGVKSRPLN